MQPVAASCVQCYGCCFAAEALAFRRTPRPTYCAYRKRSVIDHSHQSFMQFAALGLELYRTERERPRRAAVTRQRPTEASIWPRTSAVPGRADVRTEPVQMMTKWEMKDEGRSNKGIATDVTVQHQQLTDRVKKCGGGGRSVSFQFIQHNVVARRIIPDVVSCSICRSCAARKSLAGVTFVPGGGGVDRFTTCGTRSSRLDAK